MPMGAKRSETTRVPASSLWGRLMPLLLLLLMPLALRVAAVDHGLPRGYVPDTHAVRAALGMVRDKHPVPEVGQYSTYPNLLPYSLIPAYVAVYVGGRVAGDWDGPEAYGDALLDDAGLPNRIARLVVALFGALTTWAVFRAARAAGLGVGAWCAAWLVATACLHTQLSVHERPWVPMVFFQALAAWGAIVYVRTSRPQHLIGCSVAAGLAFACHQSGLATFALCGLAWIFALREGVGSSTAGQRLMVGLGALAAGLVAALLLGHPYLLVHGATPTQAVVGAGGSDFSVGGQGVVLGLRWQSLVDLSAALLAYDPILVFLGLAGAMAAWRRARLRPVVVFAGAWAAFFMTQQNDHIRYLLPLTVFLALFGGAYCELHWRRGSIGVALLAILALPLIQDLRLVHVLRAEDVRVEAERHLAALPQGAFVAIDRYGPAVDLSMESLVGLKSLRDGRGESLRTRELWRWRQLERGAAPEGIRAVAVEELLEFDERAGTLNLRAEQRALGGSAGEVLRALGVTHVLLVDRISGDGSSNLLASELGETRTEWVLGPWRAGCAPGEARLPHELERAVRTLWSVDRPGPRMELVELIGG